MTKYLISIISLPCHLCRGDWVEAPGCNHFWSWVKCGGRLGRLWTQRMSAFPSFLFKVLFFCLFNPQKDSMYLYTDERDVNEAEADPLVSQRTFDMLTIETCASVLCVSDWVSTVGSWNIVPQYWRLTNTVNWPSNFWSFCTYCLLTMAYITLNKSQYE